MPVVPFAPTLASTPRPTPPAEPFALMAAAQMHSEGRLVAPYDPRDASTWEGSMREDREKGIQEFRVDPNFGPTKDFLKKLPDDMEYVPDHPAGPTIRFQKEKDKSEDLTS